MLVAWHCRIWWNSCMSEDENEEILHEGFYKKVLTENSTFTRKSLSIFTENHTWRPDIIQNVLISCILLISLEQDVSILFVNNMYCKY